MLVNNNGNILNVTNKFTLGQLLKNGATEVKEEVAEETKEHTKEVAKEVIKEVKQDFKSKKGKQK